MIIVRVELWSAVTGERTELARAVICNTGHGTAQKADYRAETLRGRGSAALEAAWRKGAVQRACVVRDYPRQRLHVWNLVADALRGMGYGRTAAPQGDASDG